jgi:hypothetical protein
VAFTVSIRNQPKYSIAPPNSILKTPEKTDCKGMVIITNPRMNADDIQKTCGWI